MQTQITRLVFLTLQHFVKSVTKLFCDGNEWVFCTIKRLFPVIAKSTCQLAASACMSINFRAFSLDENTCSELPS